MLNLYVGTPGSGKSYHACRYIVELLRTGKNVISSFWVDSSKLKPYWGKKLGCFIYVDLYDITPIGLKGFSRNFHKVKGGRVLEGQTLVVFDECQRIFDARTWNERGRKEWNDFFCEHRKYGYDILLITQVDRMIDKKMRGLVEYLDMHRKINNYNWMGKLLCLFAGGDLYMCIHRWYGLNEKLGSKIIRGSKKYYNLYQTSLTFDKKEDK